MESVVDTSTVRFFADDTRISHQIRYSHQQQDLQNDLDNIMKWSVENNMKLHEQKFELLIHEANPRGMLRQLPFGSQFWSYTVSDRIQIEPTDCLRDLGISVADDLSWTVHIQMITTKAKSISAWVLSVFQSRDQKTMMTL